MKRIFTLLLFVIIPLLQGCSQSHYVVNGVDEREANIILVLLGSKGISAEKIQMESGGIGGDNTSQKYSVSVPQKHALKAISILNKHGFPKPKGETLLDIFAKKGLVTSSDKEEEIRYQSGLAQQITNTIMMIDGIISCTVQLSFPAQESQFGQSEQEQQRVTAAVYVKHQGVVDDPNLHLESKIKRLVSGSVAGLDVNDVTVVSDRSKLTDIKLDDISTETHMPQGYIKIWGIIVADQSSIALKFTLFSLLSFIIILALLFGWIMWKCYPVLKANGGFKSLLRLPPFGNNKNEDPQQYE